MSREHAAVPESTLYAALAIVAIALVWALREVLVLVGFALLFAYFLDPLVTRISHLRVGAREVPRGLASSVVVVALVVGVGWALFLGVPRLVGETLRFAENLPAVVARLGESLERWGRERGLESYVQPAIAGFKESGDQLAHNLGGIAMTGLRVFFGTVGQVLGFLVLPLLIYYLLAEREGVQHSLLRFTPQRWHDLMRRAGAAADRALKSYVRGQGVVCLLSGLIMTAVLALLGFPSALLLGVLAGFGEIVPYLGFALTAVAIALAGLSQSPAQAVWGVIAYVLENQVVSFVLTPRIMNRYLKLHPFMVLLAVFAGAQLLGAAGVLLAIPMVAVIQALVHEFAVPRSAEGRRRRG